MHYISWTLQSGSEQVQEGRINERREKLVGGGAHLARRCIQSRSKEGFLIYRGAGQENTASGKISICYEYYA